MLYNILKKVAFALLICSTTVNISSVQANTLDVDIHQVQTDPVWKGTASCTIENSDGKIETLTVSCSGELSKEDAKNKLNQKMRAEINSAGGTTKSSITFSLEKTF